MYQKWAFMYFYCLYESDKHLPDPFPEYGLAVICFGYGANVADYISSIV